jgi:hypothetical protein
LTNGLTTLGKQLPVGLHVRNLSREAASDTNDGNSFFIHTRIVFK